MIPPILNRPYSFGQTGMTYVAGLNRFVLIGWRYDAERR